jgi:maleate isomerase
VSAPVERWMPDGWDATLRIGVLTPAADVGPESELQAMAPAGVVVHAARVPFGAMAPGGSMDPTIAQAPVRAFAEQPALDEAAEMLAQAPIHVVAFGFTSSAYVLGPAGEAAMIERLATRTRGIPVVAPCAAAIEALGVLGVRRVAVVDPPWFDEEMDRLGARHYEEAGFEVVMAASCGLPSDQAAITPRGLLGWLAVAVPDEAEAVVVGGNGFRAVGAIRAAEERLGRPVLSANQVLLWAALRAARADPAAVTGYGRVFAARA